MVKGSRFKFIELRTKNYRAVEERQEGFGSPFFNVSLIIWGSKQVSLRNGDGLLRISVGYAPIMPGYWKGK